MQSIHLLGSSSLRRKRERAVIQGATLASLTGAASCSGDTVASNEQSPNDSSTDAAGDSARESLPPYDLERLGCWGPHHDGGYMGQCCVKAHCYTPPAGAGGASAEQVAARSCALSPPYPPGSGGCTCKLGEGSSEFTAGPFASNSADPAKPDGECCYLVGSISCVGRPLVVRCAAAR
jgi:hypothetical protein